MVDYELAAIVTGGSSGLGRATVEMLRSRNGKVAILDQNDSLGTELARETGSEFFKVDLTSAEEVRHAFDQAEKRNGPARLLVNCAGIALAGKTISPDPDRVIETFRKVLEVNLVGTYIALVEFANRVVRLDMAGEERGLIINTSSVEAEDGQIGHAAYTASKAAIAALSLPIARELAEHAVRVVTIAPGLFNTLMTTSALNEELRTSLASQVTFPKRMGNPSEFADLVSAIISNPMLNGSTIKLDAAISLSSLRLDDVLANG